MEREMLMFEEYLAKKTTTSNIYTHSYLSLLLSSVNLHNMKQGG